MAQNFKDLAGGGSHGEPVNPGAPNQPSGQQVDQEKLAQIEGLSRQAVGILYGDEKNFQNMVDMFREHGPDGFGEAMSIATNTVLDRLESDSGQLDPESLAGVGVTLIGLISRDLTEGGLMEITDDMMIKASAYTLNRWMVQHQDRIDPEEAQMVAAQAGQL